MAFVSLLLHGTIIALALLVLYTIFIAIISFELGTSISSLQAVVNFLGFAPKKWNDEMVKWIFFFWIISVSIGYLHVHGQSISIPFIGNNDSINHTVVTLSDDRQLEHPDIPKIFKYLHECEAQLGYCDMGYFTSLVTRITNGYLSLLLPEKALQLLDDISYFLDHRQELLRTKLTALDLALNMAIGHTDKAAALLEHYDTDDDIAFMRSNAVFQFLVAGNESMMGEYFCRLNHSLKQVLSAQDIKYLHVHDEGDELMLSFLFREFQGFVRTRFILSDLNVLFSTGSTMAIDKLRFRIAISLAKIGLTEFSSKLLGFSASPWEDKWSRLRASLVFHPVYSSVGLLARSLNHLELNVEQFLLEMRSVYQPCNSFLEIATALQSLPLVQLSGFSAPREGSVLGHSPVAFPMLFSEVLSKMCEVGLQRKSLASSWEGKDRIRIGIVGGSFDGVHGRLIIGLLDSIPISLRNQVEVVAVCFPTAKSSITDKVTSLFDKHINIPDERLVAVERIHQAKLHLLLYSDANYDARVFTLAHERLAPMQAALWGWGGTIGLKSLDYYIMPEVLVSQVKCPSHSTNSKKIHQAAFFQEQTLLLDGFPPLPRMAPLSLEETRHIMRTRYLLDISNKTNIYLYPTSAKYFHPEYDKVVEVILLTDPSAIFVVAVPKLARDNIPAVHSAVRHDLMHPSMPVAVVSKLKQRLWNSIHDNVDRVRFLPPLDEPIFRSLQVRADVVLDSFPVGLQLPIFDAFWDNAAVLSAPHLQECVSSFTSSIGYALKVRAYSSSSGVSLPTSAEEFGVLAVRIARDKNLRKLFSLPQMSEVNANSRSSHFTQIYEFLKRKLADE